MSSKRKTTDKAEAAKSATPEVKETKLETTAEAAKDIHNPDVTEEVPLANEDTTGNEPTPTADAKNVSNADKGTKTDSAYDKRLADLEKREAEIAKREQAVQSPANAAAHVDIVDETPEAQVADAKKVKVTAIANHETNIGGIKYNFTKGETYDVPEDVATILSNAFIAVKK